jgi:ribulose-5-phosphate 4-epimerase/fuculose-1-phosphate aldolase
MDSLLNVYRDLTIAAHRAYDRGTQLGSGGNISARFDASSMIVKASGGSFADCDSNGQGWVKTDFEGNVLGGSDLAPTREVHLHGCIYNELSEVNGIVHVHAPWSIAYAQSNDRLECITHQAKLKFGCDYIPIIDIDYAVVPKSEMHRVQEVLRENDKLPAFILKGHGVVAMGKDVVVAEHISQMIEETAQVALLVQMNSK